MIRVVLSEYSTEYLITHFFNKFLSYCWDIRFETLKEKIHYSFIIGDNTLVVIDGVMDKNNFYLNHWIVDFHFPDKGKDKADNIGWVFNVLSGLKIIKICGDEL